ncbi:MAG: methyl-accepting chemotaxis protein [Spirochaetia bacterium]|nr:methyl-accepting chemotaxis protein [Spirochaetia bacterium]
MGSKKGVDSEIKPMSVHSTGVESVMKDGTTLVTKTDLRGIITYANQHFSDISEISINELIGKPHNIIRNPDMPRSAFFDLWKILQSGKPWRGMVKNLAKNGNYYWVDANVAPQRENNEVVGYISIRRKPERAAVEKAEALYKNVREGKTKFPSSDRSIFSVKSRLLFMIFLNIVGCTGAGVLIYLNLFMFTLPFLMAAGVIFNFIYGLYIIRYIIKPLSEATNIANKIASGDLKVSIQHNRNDEFGELHKALLNMLINTAGIIAEIQENVIKLNNSSKTLREQSQTMSAGLEETSSQSENIAASADEMNQTLQVLAGSVEEMSITIGEVSGRAANSAKIVENANSSAQIANSVVKQLGESASEIGNVVETIASIAAQTNLLALNASIEAAGAGEAGKGFAVVANEVKELARQSAESSVAVKEKVEAIQKNVSETVDSMKTIIETFSEVKEISTTIASAVEEQSIASKEIASNVSQVSTASNDVTKNVNGISSTSKDGARSSAETAEMVVELDKISNVLTQVAKQFRV